MTFGVWRWNEAKGGMRFAFPPYGPAGQCHRQGRPHPGQTAEPLRQKLLNAFDNGKIRMIPREDDKGNRLALRRDIGSALPEGRSAEKQVFRGPVGCSRFGAEK